MLKASRGTVKAIDDGGGSRHALRGEIFNLYAHQAVGVGLRATRVGRELPERPRAATLARHQPGAGIGHLATLWHGTLRLDAFASRLVSRLDGTATCSELMERLVADIHSGELSVADGTGKPPAGFQRRSPATASGHSRCSRATGCSGLPAKARGTQSRLSCAVP